MQKHPCYMRDPHASIERRSNNLKEMFQRCLDYVNEVLELEDSVDDRPRNESRRPGDWKEIRREVSRHFRHYAKERKACDNILEEFAEARNVPEVAVQTGPQDPTLAAITRAESQFKELFDWTYVVEITFRRFKGTPQGDVLCEHYRNGLSMLKVQDKLHMSSSSAYEALNTCLQFAALRAAERRLLSLR